MDVENLLSDTITISTRTGQDVHGGTQYSAQRKVPARVDTAYALTLSLHAADLTFSHAICLESPLNPDDRVWIEGDDTTQIGSARRVIRSAAAYTGDGSYKLYMAYL